MAHQLDYPDCQPLPFCNYDCPHMELTLTNEALYGDGRIVERCITVHCRHEEVCKAARRQLREEIIETLPT